MASPIAALIVRILADTAEIKESLKNAEDQFGKFQAAASAVGKALLAAFSITAIVAFAKKTIDLAGRMTDLAAKTGFSTDALQKFGLVFEENGVSIDQVTQAASALQRRLVEGDKSTVSALSKLGLAAEDLKQLKPEDQFLAVADAVGRIPNPTERAYAAMQLFGRGGADLLPGLNGQLAETAQRFEKMGLIISEETLVAADTFGDQLGVMGRQLMALMASVLAPLLPLLTGLGEILIWVGNKVIGPILNVAVKSAITVLAVFWERIALLLSRLAELGSKIPGIGDKFKDLSQWLKDSAERTGDFMADTWTGSEKVAEKAPKATGALMGFGKAADEASEKAKKFRDAVSPTLTPLQGLRVAIPPVVTHMAALREMASMLGSRDLIGLNAKVEMTEIKLQDVGQEALVSADAFQKIRGETRGLTDSLRSLASGDFGQVFKDLGGFMKGGLGKIGTGFLESIGSSLFAGVGALASKALGFLGSKIGGFLFGDKEHKQVNDLRDDFVSAAGGLHALNVKAAEAGMTLDALLSAKKVKDFEAAVEGLNGAFAFQDSAMQTLRDTVEKYGIELSRLPDHMQAAALDEKAGELIKDFEVLKAGGVELNAVMEHMGPHVQEFVNQALALGHEVPEAMRPMLQRMVDMGTLVDANGDVITDLEEAGITFAMTMSEGFGKLIDEVKKLTDAITRGLGGAIANVPRHIPIDFEMRTSGVNPDDFGGDLPGFASGTRGRFVDFGAGTPVMLHGQEKVVTKSEDDRMAQMIRRLPEMIGLAMRDALVQAG